MKSGTQCLGYKQCAVQAGSHTKKDVTRGTQATTLQLTPATEGRNQHGRGPTVQMYAAIRASQAAVSTHPMSAHHAHHARRALHAAHLTRHGWGPRRWGILCCCSCQLCLLAGGLILCRTRYGRAKQHSAGRGKHQFRTETDRTGQDTARQDRAGQPKGLTTSQAGDSRQHVLTMRIICCQSKSACQAASVLLT
jgi:hypothetical protein